MAFPLAVQKEIAKDNLRIGERAVSSTAEARLSHLSDLVRIVLTERGGELSDLAGLGIPDPLDMTCHREILPENRRPVGALLAQLSAYDRVMFSVLLCRQKGFSVSSFFGEAGSGERIAYYRSGMTDACYDDFSLLFRDPTVLYCSSYRESCEAVASGESAFCILPLRDERGQLVRAALSLAVSASLLAVATVTVRDGEDTASVYALFGKAPLPGEDPTDLIVTVPDADPPLVTELVAAVPVAGLTLSDIAYDEASRTVSLAARGKEGIVPFLCYLSLFCPERGIGGCYFANEGEKE